MITFYTIYDGPLSVLHCFLFFWQRPVEFSRYSTVLSKSPGKAREILYFPSLETFVEIRSIFSQVTSPPLSCASSNSNSDDTSPPSTQPEREKGEGNHHRAAWFSLFSCGGGRKGGKERDGTSNFIPISALPPPPLSLSLFAAKMPTQCVCVCVRVWVPAVCGHAGSHLGRKKGNTIFPAKGKTILKRWKWRKRNLHYTRTFTTLFLQHLLQEIFFSAAVLTLTDVKHIRQKTRETPFESFSAELFMEKKRRIFTSLLCFAISRPKTQNPPPPPFPTAFIFFFFLKNVFTGGKRDRLGDRGVKRKNFTHGN